VKRIGAGWRRVPFVKLLAAMASGILLEFYYQLGCTTWISVLCISLFVLIGFFFLPFFKRFQLSLISGVSGFCVFISLGGILLYERNIETRKNWIGLLTEQALTLEVVVEEPPLERPNSIRLLASVQTAYINGKARPCRGKIFIYLKKDSFLLKQEMPSYGTVICFKEMLLPIRGFGNPGGFDFGHYCRMKGITHQLFASISELRIEKEKNRKLFKTVINSMREWVLETLRKNFKDKKKLGLAEALLIGYKNDLDKSLVKDYADTGVVHIIAISGLHVGLIYWLLGLLLLPLKRAGLKWIPAILIIAGLWLFSFLAGAQPSILRAALMFTCIVIEKQVSGRNSTYNTIAFSAFALLCIEPKWLWDAGFQLSYAAVVSIIAFMKPVYSLLFFRNKLFDSIWKMTAVTIAAQVLTLPLCIYYFQQFPVYFLLTNLLAVPLSTAILFGEILLLAFAFIPFLAGLLAKILSGMIQVMNQSIEIAAQLPFATWESLNISAWQSILLGCFTLSLGFGLVERSGNLLRFSAFAILIFSTQRLASFIHASQQELLVVYNVPKGSAIDFVEGRKFTFLGDSALKNRGPQREFYLEPSRTYLRTTASMNSSFTNSIRFGGKRILLLDKAPNFTGGPVQTIDLLVLSRNPKLYFSRLSRHLEVGMVVIDGSVPAWKSRYWKKDCDSLGIPYHDVSERGAFVMKIR
jgi:competence protein ComEC